MITVIRKAVKLLKLEVKIRKKVRSLQSEKCIDGWCDKLNDARICFEQLKKTCTSLELQAFDAWSNAPHPELQDLEEEINTLNQLPESSIRTFRMLCLGI